MQVTALQLPCPAPRTCMLSHGVTAASRCRVRQIAISCRASPEAQAEGDSQAGPPAVVTGGDAGRRPRDQPAMRVRAPSCERLAGVSELRLTIREDISARRATLTAHTQGLVLVPWALLHACP